MSWIVLALASVIFFSISALLQKVLMKNDKSDPYAYSIMFQFLIWAVAATVVLWTGFVMPPIKTYPLNFLFSSVMYGLGTICAFKALKYIEASEFTIISSVKAIVTIISAVLILGEVFDYKKALGTALVLISAYLVTQKSRKIKFNKGTLYALGTALTYGLAITNDTFLLKYSEVFSYLTVGNLITVLFVIAIKPTAVKNLNHFFDLAILSKMLILGILYSFGAVAFYLAIQSGAAASQISPILQTSVIVTVLLAAIFLGERDNLVKKIASAILVTIGVILIK
ncbi:MAG: DMT family transporter [Candidatus Curtissbacteria bacterium]|nr:DMT family transporter [Candidatus Curtissbacteria bacterium]